jgi:hypothetical protein
MFGLYVLLVWRLILKDADRGAVRAAFSSVRAQLARSR